VNEKFTADPEKYGYWTTKGWPDPAKLSIAYVTALNDAIAAGTWTPPSKDVAIYGEDTDWGRSFGGGLKQQFTDTGWNVVSEDFFPTTQTDFSALVNRYKTNNTPVIVGTSTIAASISAFIKQANDAGIKAMIVADGLGWIGEWYSLTGSSADYVLDEIPGWTTEAAQKFATDYEAKYGSKPSPSASGLSYDFTNFFIEIMKQTLADSGSITSETLYQTAKDKLWTGQLTFKNGIIMSNYEFSEETLPDPIVGKGYYIFPVLQYFGGEPTVIWPADWKTGDLKAKP
jgi:branched-chain amino acid transport system substrate-binding protein